MKMQGLLLQSEAYVIKQCRNPSNVSLKGCLDATIATIGLPVRKKYLML